MQLEVMPKSCGGDTSISRVENAVREESQGSVIRTKFKYVLRHRTMFYNLASSIS